MISGRMLAVVPGKLIVQQWRSVHFGKERSRFDSRSPFRPGSRRGRIDLAHINVPKAGSRAGDRGLAEALLEAVAAISEQAAA